MSRLLYRVLLWLHPPHFRQRFSHEMLFVFDELAAERGGRSLLSDGLRSLGRQWFFGFGLWKAMLAIVLAMAPILMVLHGVGKKQRRWMDQPRSPVSAQMLPVGLSGRN